MSFGDVPATHAGEFTPGYDLALVDTGLLDVLVTFGFQQDHGILQSLLTLSGGKCGLASKTERGYRGH